MNKPELLAPAGSMESLTAALRCGADAVYIGGKSFSARHNAVNFDLQELHTAIKICHTYGKKLYLAVNTIIFDSQVNEFEETIEKALECGVDAFIVQDLGAAEIIKTISPDARLHASTQMTIHSPSGALTAKKLGFKRVVLSRELSQKQISEISSPHINIETEIFVHGALCMSVSGQCYLSALIGQRSANRGLCAQPCRLPFSAVGNRENCGLSLKDLSLAQHIDNVIKCSVTSLKIEGRMKRPEYVAAAVTAFRNVLDGKPFDLNMLKAVFSRSGFTDGYFTGKVSDMFGKREKEDVVSAKKIFPEIHKLYRNERKTADIHFSAEIKCNRPVKLTVTDNDDRTVSVTGSIPKKAENKPVDAVLIEKQLSKLGNTVYNYGGTESEIDDGLSVSAGELNELRRTAVEALNSERIKANTPVYSIFHRLPDLKTAEPEFSETEIRARISSISMLESAVTADRIILPMEIISEKVISNLNKIILEKIIIEPPAFISDEHKIKCHLEVIKRLGVSHLMCNNIAYLKIGEELRLTLHGDFRLNVSNSYSANLLSKLGVSDTVLSFELKTGQALSIQSKSPVPVGIIAYGRLPVMLTKNCPIKNEIGCKGKKCRKIICDRTGKNFPVVCNKDYNYTEILNSQTLYLADKLNDFRNMNFMVLYFTNEKPEVISDMICRYRYGGNKMENITRGLYYRGSL